MESQVQSNLIKQGRAWCFRDNIAIDGDLLPHLYVRKRLTDPIELAKHIFERLDPTFASRVQPGDLVITGRRFGHGNPHAQGFRGLAGAQVGLLTEWMPRGAYRCCVVAGVPFLPYCEGISRLVDSGDQLWVNFRTGEVRNLTKGLVHHFKPPHDLVIDIVEAGGTIPHLQRELAARQVR